MRRIYHRFPQPVDLDFELSRPFMDVLACIQRMHNTHTTERREGGLVKQRIVIQLSDGRTQFEDLDNLPPLEETISEAADFRIDLQDTLLRPDRRVPVSQNNFFLRVVDKGPITECYVVKDGRHGDIDAMDIRQLLKGACE
jgi:hypothetical protein